MKIGRNSFAALRRPIISTLALCAAGALVLTGCAGGGSAPADKTADTSSLTFGVSADIPKMTAGLNQGTLGMIVNSILQRGLLQYDEQGAIVPALAETYEMTDPQTWTFTLREGLTFHDDSPITSATVKASLEHFAKPETNASGFVAFSHITSVDTPDDLTVVVNLDAPNVAFADYLADPNHSIFPVDALNGDTDNVVGAGPFELVKKNNGVSLELEKFDGYYDADQVSLENLTLASYADGTARVNALQSGDVDLIEYVPWESFQTIEANDDLVLDATPGPVQEIMFNTSSGPLADPKVRQAIAYSIDRDAMATTVFEGHAKPLFGVGVAESSVFDTPAATEMYEFDPAQAKKLLAEAGYPDGFDITITANSTYSFVQDTGLSLQSSLKDIGINATMKTPDWPTFIEATNSGDYEIGISGGVGYVSGPAYLSSFVSGPGNLIRSFGYENLELDAALKQGAEAATEAEAQEAYASVFKIIQEDTPVIFPVQREQGYGYNKSVSGFKNLPGFLTNFSGYTLAQTSKQ